MDKYEKDMCEMSKNVKCDHKFDYYAVCVKCKRNFLDIVCSKMDQKIKLAKDKMYEKDEEFKLTEGLIMNVFQSPNICRDLSSTSEFKTLANLVRDDFGHKMVEVKKTFHEQKKILTGFRISPIYKSMLLLFCPDVVSISIKHNDLMKIYGLPVIEDEEVSCIQFEFK